MVRRALNRDIIVVHYHFGLQRLVDYMGLVHVSKGLLLDGRSLKRSMHVVDLSVGPNGRGRGHLLLGLRLSTVGGNGSASILSHLLLALVAHLLREGTSHVAIRVVVDD